MSSSPKFQKKPNQLSSDWTGLSMHLLAEIFPVRKVSQGSGWERGRKADSATDIYAAADDGKSVLAPMSDGQSELTANWTSPFENAGAESMAGTFSAMLQSGAFTSLLQSIGGSKYLPGGAKDTIDSLADSARTLEGKSGVTKLNSMQVFSGMPPASLTFTLHFRAYRDPITEVREPLLRLKEWAVPQYLAPDGALANAASGRAGSAVDAAYPSRTPQIIGVKYGDMTYMPMVIESMSDPITNPRTEAGVMTECSVQLKLASLTALDRADIRSVYQK